MNVPGHAVMLVNLSFDIRGVTDPNDLNCVPPNTATPVVRTFTTGVTTSGIMDAFGSLGMTQAQTLTGTPQGPAQSTLHL